MVNKIRMYNISEITNKILRGAALTELKKVPSNCIDCVVTSPPYWSLRSYSTTPQIWDGDEKCEHNFDSFIRKGQSGGTNSEKVKIKDMDNFQIVPDSQHFFCSKCGAWKGELGLEPNFQLFIQHLIQIFDEVKRVLKPSGTCWVNLGDSYASGGGASRHKGYTDPKYPNGRNGSFDEPSTNPQQGALPKSLCQIPSRFAIEMTNRGWILRNEIIWYKRNCMPSSATDRFTVDFEKIFFFTKSKKYFFEQQFEPSIDPESINGRRKRNPDKYVKIGQGAIQNWDREGEKYVNRNKRCVWDITTKGEPSAHFAVYPQMLTETPIKAGCPEFVCNKCGKAREKIFEQTNYSEDGIREVEMLDSPYAIKERSGTIEFRKLPPLNELKKYLTDARKKAGLTIDEVEQKLNSQAPHHWFSGESYPTKKDWTEIKNLLNFNDTFDDAMTKEYFKPAEKLAAPKAEAGYSDCGCNAGFSGGIVLDPFFGSGTTGIVAKKLNRNYCGIEINSEYIKIAEKRLYKELGMFL